MVELNKDQGSKHDTAVDEIRGWNEEAVSRCVLFTPQVFVFHILFLYNSSSHADVQFGCFEKTNSIGITLLVNFQYHFTLLFRIPCVCNLSLPLFLIYEDLEFS